MAGSRDDMVLRPPAGPMGTDAQRANREIKRSRKAAGRKSALGRGIAVRLKVKAARGLAGVSNRAGLRATGTVAVVAGAALLVAVVGASLLTGRSTENMGQQLQKILLGDIGPEAIAKMRTREQMEANADMMALANMGGGITKQMREVGDHLYRLNLADEKGKAMFMQDKDMQGKNQLDLVLDRLKQLFAKKWHANGGPQAVAEFEHAARVIMVRTGRIRGLRTMDDL